MHGLPGSTYETDLFIELGDANFHMNEDIYFIQEIPKLLHL